MEKKTAVGWYVASTRQPLQTITEAEQKPSLDFCLSTHPDSEIQRSTCYADPVLTKTIPPSCHPMLSELPLPANKKPPLASFLSFWISCFLFRSICFREGNTFIQRYCPFDHNLPLFSKYCWSQWEFTSLTKNMLGI